jgi:hypothetical protein
MYWFYLRYRFFRLLDLRLYPEDGGNRFLENTGNFVPSYRGGLSTHRWAGTANIIC